jgi:hypothetical protein
MSLNGYNLVNSHFGQKCMPGERTVPLIPVQTPGYIPTILSYSPAVLRYKLVTISRILWQGASLPARLNTLPFDQGNNAHPGKRASRFGLRRRSAAFSPERRKSNLAPRSRTNLVGRVTPCAPW